jgi:hypothetical protein
MMPNIRCPSRRAQLFDKSPSPSSPETSARHHPIDGVRPIDPDTAKWIADNVSAYGEALAPLNEENWENPSQFSVVA